jgi:hypothetical protein
VVFPKVNFECVVVEVVLLLATTVLPVADMASFMLVATMCVELVITVKSFVAETTLGMTFETALVNRSRIVVTSPFMFAELGSRE